MTTPPSTAGEAFAIAGVQHAAAEQARCAAQSALNDAIAARQSLIKTAAATGDDAKSALRQHRQAIDGLTDDLDMAAAIEARALDGLQRAEIAVMADQAAAHVNASHDAISHAVKTACAFDCRLEEAKTALAAVFAALGSVAQVHGAAWQHDETVAMRASHNAVLGMMHSSQQPRSWVGGRKFESPDLEVDAIQRPSGTRFGHPLGAVLLSRYRDCLPSALVMKLLADATSAKAA